ncbi:hypothetical protein ACH5RR_015084 [Cinchona calisaya]|uniref:Uncharacterized protein n=1 Tax=Cinchona calisaya TaxID=153742 RepID=A0ABD2ZV87_9GENT
MNILITKRPILQLGPQFSPQNFIFYTIPLSHKNLNFIPFSSEKCSCNPKTLTFCSNTAFSESSSISYGGWDHPHFNGKFDQSSEYKSFLISLGIGDKKFLFVYLLGFVCALAISRIKVSSLIGFPACAVVFGVGFSMGFFNGGNMSLNGAKKRPKDDNFKDFVDKLGNLVDLLSGVDVKIVNLKNGIKKGIECNQISLEDLKGFLKTLESIYLGSLNAKSIAEDCMGSVLVENQDLDRNLNQNSSRRKKEVGENGFSFLGLLGNFFRGKETSSKAVKMKDSSKRESDNVEVNNQVQDNILAPLAQERTSKSLSNRNVENDDKGLLGNTSDNEALNRGKAENLSSRARRMNTVTENENVEFEEMDGAVKAVLKSNKYTYEKRRLEYMSNREASRKTGHAREGERWASHDGLIDSMDFRVSLKHRKTETSYGQEQNTYNLQEQFEDFDSIENAEKEAYGSFVRGENVIPDTENCWTNDKSTMASDDMEFSRCLAEANILLKEAKECFVLKGDDEVAENFLRKSAGLLSKAINIRPMSLLAVGQLGNTFLLHGELKLRLSRGLRAQLGTVKPLSVDKWETTDNLVSRKDKIASVLVNVCEECEELLVNAGRKYSLALSIDGNDMRAMYNWGLALFFRAQLIADIGPAAARDADKIFLAAIDKFDAMMSKSNVHAPDALYRWGATLQQRSRLRPRNSKEKVKLLQQARRLYEDALDFDSENMQVQKALSSCVSELKYWYD